MNSGNIMESFGGNIREYYRGTEPDLSAVTDPSFRHFRFMLSNGRFLKVRDRITSGGTLKKWLLRYAPSDVYYSTSCFLSPENIGRRDRSLLSRNVFLFSDIVFDVDYTCRGALEKARKETLKLIDHLDGEGLEIKYIAFSGSKGFHVVCRDAKRYGSPDPLEREAEAIERRKMILGNVEAAGITVDGKITTDTRRIIRVPGTVNSKTGYVCTVISRGRLEEPIKETLKYVKKVNINAPLIPARVDENMLRIIRRILGPVNRSGARFGPAPRGNSYATYLKSIVPGTKRHVPIFEYRINRNFERIKRDLSDILDTYSLSDIYLFKSASRLQALSLGTLDKRRLEKVIKASGSINYNCLMKYGMLYFRCGRGMDENLRAAENAPVYAGVLGAPQETGQRYVSRPHYNFLAGQGVPVRSYGRMHGSGEVRLSHVLYGS